ncbi:O-antigen polysaccharide polymerase Wzy [uncultured Tenacibaculum sp.]|uniref:O-antigen polysaccharide polymerase Wzy n=1 Tax=uncultured Tenacibaculum sp. TaxID=174713 RepID=UPI00260F2159|nr:O-antigen polysaccharide polymerase Wzy [uncultured Tenacibaculum sp.]
MRIVQIILLLINCFLPHLDIGLSVSSSVAFWSYIIIICLEVAQKKRITMLILFLSAFVYMVLSEGVLNENYLYELWGRYYTTIGYSYLITSSTCVFLGCKFYETYVKKTNKLSSKELKTIIHKKNTLLLILTTYSLFFFIINIENTIYGFTIGRASAFPFLISPFLYAVAFICVGLYNEVFSNKIYTILMCLPIIITFIGTGTRFFLVYIIFILYFKDLYFLNYKRIFKLFFLGFFLLSALNVMKLARSGGLSNLNESKNTKEHNLTEYLASKGSNEGLISNAAMITKYTTENDYTYGKSTSFLTIFWIPRDIWPNKPVQLDSWLIRKYMNVSEGFSSASSYGGEIYIDFGYSIGCILLLILGYNLSRIQNWIHNNYKTDLKKLILSGFLYGWIFFGTRSIMTSTFMLIYMLIMSNVIFKILIKFKIVALKPIDE